MSAAADRGCSSDAAPAAASVESRLGAIESVLSDLGATMRRMEAAPAAAQSNTTPDAGAQTEVTRMVREAIDAANAAGVESGSFRRGASSPSAFAVPAGHQQDGSGPPSIRAHSPTPSPSVSRRATADSDTNTIEPAATDSGSGRGGAEATEQVRTSSSHPCSPTPLTRSLHIPDTRVVPPLRPLPFCLRRTEESRRSARDQRPALLLRERRRRIGADSGPQARGR